MQRAERGHRPAPTTRCRKADGRSSVMEILTRHAPEIVMFITGGLCIALPIALAGVDWPMGAACAFGGVLVAWGALGVEP